MRIALVADVEHKLILRTVEDIVHGNSGLGEAEVRTYMASVLADSVKYTLADLIGKGLQFVYGQTFHVCR